MAAVVSPISSRKMVPPWATSKSPGLSVSAPVNAPLLVPEQFTLEQRLRQGPTIDGDKRPVPSWAMVMDGTGDEFFAGPRVPLQQHRDGGWDSAIHERKDLRPWPDWYRQSHRIAADGPFHAEA